MEQENQENSKKTFQEKVKALEEKYMQLEEKYKVERGWTPDQFMRYFHYNEMPKETENKE